MSTSGATTPVRHRYVHGGFEGTDTRFSFYFPPAEQWRGRLLQPLEGGNGGHENTAQGGMGSTGGIAFAAASGCYLVESNQGHFGDDMRILLSEPTVGAYRASAESARYSWELAAEMYGRRRTTATSTAGSGGSARCLLCLEQCPDVWQGAVPVHHGPLHVVVVGLLGAGARGARARPADGRRHRRGRARWHRRSVRRPEHRAARGARRHVPRRFPAGAESSFGTSGYAGTFVSHISALEKHDPTYIDDFWNVPGYMGADGELATSLIEEKTTVTRVVTAADLAATGDPRGACS